MRLSSKILVPLALIAAPAAASAHPSLYQHSHTFMTGVTHPLTGFDHLLAMIAVGLLASQKGGRAVWIWPATFVSAMIVGGTLGMDGIALPLMEPMIAASLLVLGLVIASALELPMLAGVATIAAFGLFHGNAHGLEAPLSGASLLYGLGFTLSTITLHVLGLSLGLATRENRMRAAVRVGAVAMAVTGGVMLFT